MRTTIIQLLLFIACSVLVAADANAVISDFNSISTKLQKLDTDVNNVSGGFVGIGSQLQVSVDSVDIDSALLATASDVEASSVFSASESSSIIDAVSNVTTTANKTLADVSSKNSVFAGLSPIVLASLYQLKNDQNLLGVSLYSKLDQSQISRGITLLNTLNSAFNAAIKVYGGS